MKPGCARCCAQQFSQHVDDTLPRGEWQHVLDAVAARTLDPYSAAADLMARFVPLSNPRVTTP